jgi:excisionase family DNA binding protein
MREVAMAAASDRRRSSEARQASRAGQVLTADQVAEYLQLNRLTVYRYIRQGKIPAARVGKLYRVLRADVDQFLEAQKVGDGAPPASEPVRAVRPRVANEREVYVGPRWRERLRDRQALADPTDTHTSDPIEWVLRGLH